MARLGVRSVIAVLSVAIMAALATWSASGFLDRGGLDRLVQMKNTPERDSPEVQKRRAQLDRGRLNSLVTASGRP